MSKIVLSDLDGTIVDKNLELDFIIFFLKQRGLFFQKLLNLLLWFSYKLFIKMNLMTGDFKFVYYNIKTKRLNESVESWLNSLKEGTKINHNIIRQKSFENHIFILTNCPSFISKPFCQKFIPDSYDYIFSTEIYSVKDTFHFQIKRRVKSEKKRKIAKKLLRIFNFPSVGYGNHENDRAFISLCDEQFLCDFFE